MHILITGASSGIGKATAEELQQRGHHLSLCSRNVEKLKGMEANAFVASCDVSDHAQVKTFVEAAEQKHGSVDVLVNNAGLGMFNKLVDAPIEEWHQMIDVNLKGLLNLIHAVLPGMRRQHSGHIINLGSVASHDVFPNSGVYCATKHAVLAISKSIRKECSDFLKVTTISPGAVDTNFIQQTGNSELREMMEGQFADGMTSKMIADQIIYAIEYDNNAVINEILIRPNKQ